MVKNIADGTDFAHQRVTRAGDERKPCFTHAQFPRGGTNRSFHEWSDATTRSTLCLRPFGDGTTTYILND